MTGGKLQAESGAEVIVDASGLRSWVIGLRGSGPDDLVPMTKPSTEPELPELSACDREPIHIPGSIQGNGLLIGFDPFTLKISAVSANAFRFLGLTPERFLNRELSEHFPPTSLEIVRKVLNSRQLGLSHPFDIAVYDYSGRLLEFTGLLLPSSKKLVLLELEPRSKNAETWVWKSLSSFEIAEGEELQTFAGAVAKQVRAFYGFDRVVVYRFEPDGSGLVIGESLEYGMQSFLNHRFPASDIPKQARALYIVNRVRQIGDVQEVPVGLVVSADHGQDPVDLTHSSLRSISPVHVEYLRNMRVSSSFSISLTDGKTLWGLIACHGRHAKHVPLVKRSFGGFLSEILSDAFLRLDSATVDQRSRAMGQSLERLLVSALRAQSSERPDERLEQGYIQFLREQLGVDHVCIKRGDRWTLSLAEPRSAELSDEVVRQLVLALQEKLSEHQSLLVSEQLPELVNCPAKLGGELAGAAVTRSPDGETVLVCLRREWLHRRVWAGNPTKPVVDFEAGRIEPRKSFETWQETVRGRSTPWTKADLHALQVLGQIL